MDYRDRILKDIADRECERIARQVIHALRRIKTTLSGDDSGLETVWDEVCVQAQYEFSYYWDAYEETINGLIEGHVARLAPAVAGAIWLQTDAGSDWDVEDDGEPWVNNTHIIDHILENHVLSVASDWHNRRIERYLDEGREFA